MNNQINSMTFLESSPDRTTNPERIDEAFRIGLNEFEIIITATSRAVEENPNSYSGSNFPEGFRTRPSKEIIEGLASEYDSQLFARYIKLTSQADQVYEAFSGRKLEPFYALNELQNNFSSDFLRKAIYDEADNTFRDFLQQSFQEVGSDPHSSFHSHIVFFQKLYDLPRPFDLLRKTEAPLSQDFRSALLSEKGMRQLVFLDKGTPAYPEGISGKEWEELDKENRRVWMREVLTTATEIEDAELADSYVYAASQDGRDAEARIVDVVRKIDTLGSEKLAKLREFNGIYALADYSLAQLERMVRIADGDPEEINRLKQHEVTVVLSNKMGDHNNILATVPETVDDENERAIFFEMQSHEDIYRAALKLHERGISWSTLIFAAHLSGGQFPISAKPSLEETKRRQTIGTIHTPAFVEQVNAADGQSAGFRGIAMHDMKGLARLVDDLMVPSRGIDDPEEVVGSKRIVFISCESAVERPVRDIDPENGEIIADSQASIVSQIANELARSDIHSTVELFGSNSSIQAKPTPRGFSYTRNIEGQFERSHADATRFTVKNGEITRSAVAEIELRNFDKAA